MAGDGKEINVENVSREDLKKIITNYGLLMDNVVVENYSVNHASDKMLGFLGDYWTLKIDLCIHKNTKKRLCFFIKLISRTNESKALMVNELNIFNREILFYSVIKNNMDTVVKACRPWSARFLTTLEDALVFEDLSELKYKTVDKFKRFDKAHAMQALSTLARFHSATIILEEKKSEKLQKPYSVHNEFKQTMNESCYCKTDTWFDQCLKGSLEAIKCLSKYSRNLHLINKIESNWEKVWYSAIELADISSEHRNVICHRDLWNNNILFHYKDDKPDDCVLVDFQGIRYQPPAGDVMFLLYCNVDPCLREQHMKEFLDHYYDELEVVLESNGLSISDIMPKDKFMISAQEQRKWGLIGCACLMPTFYLNDELTTKYFCDSAKFADVMFKKKGQFIKEMMIADPNYREKVMALFEEIIEGYCI